MKLSEENIKRLNNIHKNELIVFLNMVVQGDYDESPTPTKEIIKERLRELKINIGYIVLQYLEERNNNNDRT